MTILQYMNRSWPKKANDPSSDEPLYICLRLQEISPYTAYFRGGVRKKTE